jgi:hypothetical protein
MDVAILRMLASGYGITRTLRGDTVRPESVTYSIGAASSAALRAADSAGFTAFLLVFAGVFALDSVTDIIDTP